MRIKKITLGLATTLVASALFSCTQAEPAHHHDYVKHNAVASTCVTKGNSEYYTCSGCEKLFNQSNGEYVEIQSVPMLDLNSKNHEGTVSLSVSGIKSEYTVGESIDKSTLTVTEKCDKCEGYAIAANDFSIKYPSENETSFIAGDVGDNKVVTIVAGSHEFKATVSVVEKANEIKGFSNLVKHCGFEPFETLEGVSAKYGTIVYKFAETEDGEYKTATELGDEYKFTAKLGEESTVFYYKAIVAAGADYEGVEKTGTITISHDHKWDLSAEDIDTFSCVCGDGFYEFNKVVDMDEQHIVVTSDNKSLSIAGTSYNSAIDTIKSIMLGGVSLGTSLDELVLTKVTKEMYGHQTIIVTVTSGEVGSMPEADHEVEVPVVISLYDLIPEEDLGEIINSDESL